MALALVVVTLMMQSSLPQPGATCHDGAMRLQGKGVADAGKTWQPAFDGSYRLLRVQHAMIQPDAIQWRGPANGLQTAVVEGNPQSAGPFTMMLKLPPGVWIQPHFHNVDKRLVVIKGELLMGHGDAVDEASVSVLKTGGVAVMPANTHHYEGGRGETVVALIATGPFTTTMVKK